MDSGEVLKKAQLLFLTGKYIESIASFTEVINAGENTEISLLSRGVAYLKAGLADRAIEDFGTVIRINNKNYRAYFYRGISLMSRNEYLEAIKDFNETLLLKPDYGTAFFARGTAYAQMGNEYEASRNIKTAISYSESSMQGFADHYGMFRTQFDRALALMSDLNLSPEISLTESEFKLLKKWLNEKNSHFQN